MRTSSTSSGSGSSNASSPASGPATTSSLIGNTSITTRLMRRVPRQGHRARPELLLDRLLQRRLVVEVARGDRGDDRPRRAVVEDLVEQLVDPLGERGHLLLLEGHADDPRAGAGLEEERALARLADGADDEPLGRVELVDHGHGASPMPGREAGPAPPPTAASVDEAERRRPFLAGGASQDRSPSWVFVASTNGRVAV